MKLGLLFAGQGSQKVGMGKDLYDSCPAFREIFDLLPEHLRQMAFEGPAEALSDTRNTQPILVAFEAGVLAALRETVPATAPDGSLYPAAAAGLSLGEYGALHAAGVWDAAKTLELVTFRGHAMHRAAEGVDCSMKAVMGLERNVLEDCCEKAGSEGVVQVTNDNCPGQLVIAGEKEAVEACAVLAKEAGARRCVDLAVSGPFHTVFMEPAGRELRWILDETVFGDEAFPVVFNAIGRSRKEGESVKDLLVKQVSTGVHFTDSIRWMAERGIDTVIEIGPGKALSGFVKKTDKNIRCFNIEDLGGLQITAEALQSMIEAEVQK